MKKNYQKPEIDMILSAQSLLQSISGPDVNISDDEVEAGEIEVKSQRYFGEWNDDWQVRFSLVKKIRIPTNVASAQSGI